MTIRITPGKLTGSIPVIGSKSDAHRALICAALADDVTVIEGMPDSGDIVATRQCLTALGAGFTENTVFPIISSPKSPVLDCRESGSTIRFLLPVAAALSGHAAFSGSGRLGERPLEPLLGQMREHGVTVTGDRIPLTLNGQLTAGEYVLPGNVSSQFISGLLLAMPLLDGDSRIALSSLPESSAYIDMTVKTMRDFGVVVDCLADGWQIASGQRYISPGKYTVEGDWSNAAFFLCAGVEVVGLNYESLQPDKAIIEALRALSEVGDTLIDVSQYPDIFPILAVAACAKKGVTRLTGAERLRLKESDRILATDALIRGLGGRTEAGPDSLTIYGTGELSGGNVDSFSDHRIAMSAAIAATICKSDVILTGAESVAKSYPEFWEDYKKLGGVIRVI